MTDPGTLLNWQAPRHWARVDVLDLHAAGEPLRIYLDGFPLPPGHTILERRAACREQLDRWRTATLWEPRGHADHYGCVVTPPERPDSDFGVLFLHNDGYSTMCGHAIIAVARAAVLGGLVAATPPLTRIRIDTPAGLVVAQVQDRQDGPPTVAFDNVPAFVECLDLAVDVAGIGRVSCDVAFGGAYYALVPAEAVGLRLEADASAELIEAGRAIKHAVSQACPLAHPDSPELEFLYGTILTETPAAGPWRNVCIFANGELDRSPTGTGVSARLAQGVARGRISSGQTQRFLSLTGTHMDGTVTGVAGGRVQTRVQGTAFVTARSQLLFDPQDPLRDGFLLR